MDGFLGRAALLNLDIFQRKANIHKIMPFQ